MKRFTLVCIVLVIALGAYAQKPAPDDWGNLKRYRPFNEQAALYGKGLERIVFMGNSITDNWYKFHPEFFFENGFIGRGISGQTTPQMLVRFRQDVVALNPNRVVILAGTNDIAGNTGYSSLEMIMDNLKNMCDIAKANGITPVLCSVLPAYQYSWKKSVKPNVLIPQLNQMIKKYAAESKITYVDFFSALVDSTPGNENGLPKKYSKDGVHPNIEGYYIMEDVLLKALKLDASKNQAKLKKNIAANDAQEFKFMSYNIRNCKGMDNSLDIERVAAVIKKQMPTIVAIQEADSVTNRYEGRYILGDLAQKCNMNAVYAPAINFGGGKYGIGILSKEKPLSIKQVALPGREEARTLLVAEFGKYIFCCTHLSLTEEDRMASVEIINKTLNEFAAKSPGKPILLAGDFNAKPDSEFIAKLRENHTLLSNPEVRTFPAGKPDRTLDYITLYNGTQKESGNGILHVPAVKNVFLYNNKVVEAAIESDHRPVICTLYIK